MMRLQYKGESFGATGLKNGSIYACLGVEYGLLRVIDESGDDYLYSAQNPVPIDGTSKGGIWEIIEDDDNGTLRKAING